MCPNWPKIELCCEYFYPTMHLTECYYHVISAFKSQSTLYSSPNVQETPFPKKAKYLKFKRQQQDLNPQSLSLKTNKNWSND